MCAIRAEAYKSIVYTFNTECLYGSLNFESYQAKDTLSGWRRVQQHNEMRGFSGLTLFLVIISSIDMHHAERKSIRIL